MQARRRSGGGLARRQRSQLKVAARTGCVLGCCCGRSRVVRPGTRRGCPQMSHNMGGMTLSCCVPVPSPAPSHLLTSTMRLHWVPLPEPGFPRTKTTMGLAAAMVPWQRTSARKGSDASAGSSNGRLADGFCSGRIVGTRRGRGTRSREAQSSSGARCPMVPRQAGSLDKCSAC